MKKSGVGTGAASIILVFAVLCLTIFALIALTTANADKALADSARRTVLGYYEADTLAERVLAVILASDSVPGNILGVDITTEDVDGGRRVSFTCPAYQGKDLSVEILLSGADYDILQWCLVDTTPWVMDMGQPVWQGF